MPFTAAASDPDGDALSFAWSGCGTGSAPSVTCQTRVPGEHTATVAVTDARGKSPLAVAEELGHEDVARLLRAQGVGTGG